MSTKAYILIETAVGKSRNVATKLGSIQGVQTVDPVTGPYDIIAVINASGLSAVGDIVTGNIHTIDGVARTVTCLSVSGD